MKIKSKIFFTALAVAVAGRALAGGILTNTNQSVAFLRHIARGVTLDADAPYYNPAGTAFMDDGWMLSLNIQSAFMTRITTTDYAPFAMNAAHIGVASHRYEGDIVSPCVPNVYATYKRNRWAVFFSAGVTGGGGRVKFRDGLGSFEQPFAVLPSAITSLGSAYGISASQYSMDCSFRGLTMNLSGQIGASYRITDWLSASAMVRLHYARNRYDGHITDIMVNPTGAAFGFDGGMMRADAFFTAVAGALQGVDPELAGMAAAYAQRTGDIYVDCIQKAWGVSPVLALYFRKGAREGHRYYVDEIWYSYPRGTCHLKQHRIEDDGRHVNKESAYRDCVYDMMSIFLRARNFDVSKYKVGQNIPMPVSDAKRLSNSWLKYRGKETFTIDGTNEKYRCLVFSFIEREDGENNELLRFYVTDDANHIPVRLDMFLSFGSAKAFLRGYKGVRNPVTSRIK